MKYTIVKVHIDNICVGDTVEIEGQLKTVGKNNLKVNGFMGTSLFGDSHQLGQIPVKKALIFHALPNISCST